MTSPNWTWSALRWVLSLSLFVALWYLLIGIFRFPAYVLPSPATVAVTLWKDGHLLLQHALMTAYEAVVGLAAALLLGVGVGLLLHASRAVRYLTYPHLVLLQAVPLIAVAPIVIVWFGFGPLAKILVVAFVCFFPVAVNAYEGFRSVDPAYRELLDTYGASRWSRYRHLYIPASLPGILSGARIAATYSVLGAVIGEWLGGAVGLGVYMTRAQRSFRTDRLFAAIVVVMAMSLMLFKLVSVIGDAMTPWMRRKTCD
jgi:ABC-type nitrate/sulfonate/bicarbonate transport system permease component